MKGALAALIDNLRAGARLATFRRVDIGAFHITLGALLGLLAFGYAFDIAVDALRAGRGAMFDPNALLRASLGTGVTFVTIAILAVVVRQPGLVLTLGVVWFASTFVPDVAAEAYKAVYERLVRDAGRWSWMQTAAAWTVWGMLTAWALAVFARAIALALSPRPARFAAVVGATTIATFAAAFVLESRFPEDDWWIAAPAPDPADGDRWRVVTEEALVRQPQLLAEATASLAPQRPGTTDLYLVGFAPYARQDVFLKDVRAAREVVGRRFDAGGRSILLVNNPATVLELPLATKSNLAAALQAVGQRIDREEDVVMLLLTSHGSKDHRLAVEFWPLQLDQVDGPALKAMLDDAGIRWRIVVVSACYSGGFVPPLADERTVVMTAASADRMSFGCSHDSEMTFFTDALFNQALRGGAPLLAAFDRARELVAARELAQGLSPPSDPQVAVGDAIRTKLPSLHGATSACAADAC